MWFDGGDDEFRKELLVGVVGGGLLVDVLSCSLEDGDSSFSELFLSA